jgi:hydroxymethylbilane synthase
MSAALPAGLEIAACLRRDDPRDALVLPDGGPAELDAVLDRLAARPRIGTSSVRRMAQLATIIRGATFVPIRGNVDTRLRKLDGGGYDALVLAAAGMQRLGLTTRITSALPVEVCVPAPGQGIVAVEIRSDDDRTRTAVAPLNDETAAISLTAERALVIALGGGCQLPLGGVALHQDGQLIIHTVVASPTGARSIRRTVQGAATAPAALGRRAAAELARDGAADILDAVRATQGPIP